MCVVRVYDVLDVYLCACVFVYLFMYRAYLKQYAFLVLYKTISLNIINKSAIK